MPGSSRNRTTKSKNTKTSSSNLMSTPSSAKSNKDATSSLSKSVNDALSRRDLTTLNSNNELLEMLQKLNKRVDTLEGKVMQLEGSLAVAGHVNTVLRDQIDDLQQYQRRSCLVIEGIPLDGEETTQKLRGKVETIVTTKLGDGSVVKEEFNDHYDKCHRIGKVKNSQQPVIVKFKTDSFREYLYRQRKKTPAGVKFKVSLTKKRIELLEIAESMSKDFEQIKFAYADPNGNTKFMLRFPYKRKWTLPFKNESEAAEKLALLSHGEDRLSDDFEEFRDVAS